MEELEMIAKAISSLGDNGQAAFTWYVVKEIVSYITGATCWFAFLYTVWKIVNFVVSKRALFNK